ncbi:MAG: hypothetical protein KF878_13375 [Planctomycetes bacterium]|nr:hypothetical protein [Planctomycetota bacterium]
MKTLALRRLAWVGSLLLGVLGQPALADEHQGVRFVPPAGWQSEEHEGVRLLAPLDLGEGEVLLAIVAGAQPATSGSPAEQIAEVAAALNDGAKVTGRTEVTTTARGARGQLHQQSWDVIDPDVGRHTRTFAVLLRGGQRAVLVLVCKPAQLHVKHEAAVRALLESLELTGPPAAPAAPPAPPAGKLPTGDTPDLFPGSTGWLPSGRGVPIPPPRIVAGKPEGLWWTPVIEPRVGGPGRHVARTTIFLADGTRASNPRPGSGELFDVEGQRRQRGNTGVGTFQLVDGQLRQSYDGFENAGPFRVGTDDSGPYFAIGEARYRPLEKATTAGLVGSWVSAGSRYVFKADGTYEMGYVDSTREGTVTIGAQGTFELDGYLIAIRPREGPGWIAFVGATGPTLIMGTSAYSKE